MDLITILKYQWYIAHKSLSSRMCPKEGKPEFTSFFHNSFFFKFGSDSRIQIEELQERRKRDWTQNKAASQFYGYKDRSSYKKNLLLKKNSISVS